MQRIEVIFSHYKPLFLWSFLMNIFLIIITQNIAIILLTKLFFLVLLLQFMNETKTASKFLVFKNLDASQLKLFAMVFLLDTLITISFLTILGVFI